MSISVTSRDSSPSPGGGAGDTASPDSFKAAVATSAKPPLSVQGNTIDTGRYIITGSNSYLVPTSGGHGNDGMVKIFDKTNNSYVDVYGDPHVYTSSGDRANFAAAGLTIDLADGTRVQFKPTAEVNGVAHIEAMAVSKDGETVMQSGYDHTPGGVTTSAMKEGGPSSALGFNDVRDTVLHVGRDGSLGTLVNSMGMQINSKNHEESLDGMGGGVRTFAYMGGVNDVQDYGQALAAQAGKAGKAGGPNAAEDKPTKGCAAPSGKGTGEAGAPAPGKGSGVAPGASAGAGDNLASLLQQLITLLQSQASHGSGAPSPAAGTPAPAAPAPAPGGAPSGPSAPHAPSNTAPGQQSASGDLASMLRQLMTLLQGQAASPQDEALIKQLLPLLQSKLDSLGGGSQAGTGSPETDLLHKLIGALQPAATPDGTTAQAPVAAAPQASGTPAPAAPQSYNPSLGISGNEIAAMLAAANGTGPAVNYADYHLQVTSTTQSTVSLTAPEQLPA